ncbi:MAG: Dihydroorotase [Candidatus Marinimicrobia bacterium]|nr:Dihydroorotase [Candidatus Neomarinimicrobiota bacterium]
MLKTKKLTGKLLLQGGKAYLPEKNAIEKRDLLIEDGLLTGMEKSIEASEDMEVIDCSSKIITPGFTDIHVHFREPGQEYKETLKSGSEAAIAGGFTTVCCMPNTDPAIDAQESVRFIRQRQEELLVDIYPVAAATKHREGKELTEYGEIAAAGAVGFTDDGSPIADSGVMRKVLEYAKIVDKPVLQHAEDPGLKANGLMHESKVSTALGLPGTPGISETAMVYRDIQIAEYVGARLHFQHVSTAGAVQLIREAKERGVKVSGEATPHHLMLTDEAVRTFDTSTKVNPPLRSRKDVDAVRKGVADGTLDVIATDHAPHALQEKEQTFDLAPPGMIGLESALGVVIKALVASKIANLETVLERLIVNPRRLMQLPENYYTFKDTANLTIIDPKEEWVFKREHVKSRSQNSPFYGSQLLGRVKGVLNRLEIADFGL